MKSICTAVLVSCALVAWGSAADAASLASGKKLEVKVDPKKVRRGIEGAVGPLRRLVRDCRMASGGQDLHRGQGRRRHLPHADARRWRQDQGEAALARAPDVPLRRSSRARCRSRTTRRSSRSRPMTTTRTRSTSCGPRPTMPPTARRQGRARLPSTASSRTASPASKARSATRPSIRRRRTRTEVGRGRA